MRRALALAGRGLGRVHPNPMVGAVVVNGGRIVGEGAHKAFGGPHAEVLALSRAGRKARGGTLYVTLEPCGHFGKTSPCADLLISCGVRRVVFGAADPNPMVRGRGLRALEHAGIVVTAGVCRQRAEQLNRDYNFWVKQQMPYAVAKVAVSLDGKIAASSGDSKWISSEISRRLAHALRAGADAVLVGVNTVLADDPLLSVRHGQLTGRAPLKVIVDSRLRTPPRCKALKSGSTLIATTAQAPVSKRRVLDKKADVVMLPSRRGRVDLKALFKELGRRGVVRCVVEGGPEIIAEALSQKLIREIFVFVAPKIIGGRTAPGPVGGEGLKRVARALPVRRLQARFVGPDLMLHGDL